MGELQLTIEKPSRENELDQSQKIFIDLLKDTRTLLELGYTQKQIYYASPIIMLLQGKGKVTLSPHPTADFTEPSIFKAIARIAEFPGGQGFIFSAKRRTLNRHYDVEAVLKAIEEDHVFPVPNWMPEVVRIGLFKQNADTKDLNFLVPCLITNRLFVNSPLGMKPKSPATQLTQFLGLNSTFKAAWVDPKVKSEFVVELDSRRLRTEPERVAFKRLSIISNPNGTYIPFGMKANLASQKPAQTSVHL